MQGTIGFGTAGLAGISPISLGGCREFAHPPCPPRDLFKCSTPFHLPLFAPLEKGRRLYVFEANRRLCTHFALGCKGGHLPPLGKAFLQPFLPPLSFAASMGKTRLSSQQRVLCGEIFMIEEVFPWEPGPNSGAFFCPIDVSQLSWKHLTFDRKSFP